MAGSRLMHPRIAGAAKASVVQIYKRKRQSLRCRPQRTVGCLKVPSHVRSSCVLATAALASQRQLKPDVCALELVFQLAFTSCSMPARQNLNDFRGQVRIKTGTFALVHMASQGLHALEKRSAMIAGRLAIEAVSCWIERRAHQPM